MQTLTIAGYLSRDAEQRSTRSGDSVTALNVPVKQGWGENERTNWFRVNVWGKRSDFAAKFVKGDFIVATGELTIGEYNGKPQYEIRVNEFQSVKGTARPREDGRGSGATPPPDDDSEIPF